MQLSRFFLGSQIVSKKRGWWVMAKCDALPSTSKQIESKYMDKRATPWEIHTHAYSHSLFSSYYIYSWLKERHPLWKTHFQKYYNQPQKRKDFSHNPLLEHIEKVHTTCPLHVRLLIQRKKKTFIRDQILPK